MKIIDNKNKIILLKSATAKIILKKLVKKEKQIR